MSTRARSLAMIVAAVAVVALAASLAAGSRGDARTLDERVREVASGLRCPVCQNLSVADSPSALAGEMRAEIATRLQAGATSEEVRAFFVQRYGEWVLLAPTREGLNLVPWLVPVVGVVVGAALWVRLLRRHPRAEEVA